MDELIEDKIWFLKKIGISEEDIKLLIESQNEKLDEIDKTNDY